MEMTKRVTALLLSLVMALSLTTFSAAEDPTRTYTLGGSLSGVVALDVSPKTAQAMVAVGANSDVCVTFDMTLTPQSGVEVPAFSFTLKPDSGMVLATALNGEFGYALNDIPTWGVLGYTSATNYYAAAGLVRPLTAETWVMSMDVKLPAGIAPGYYYLDVVTNSDVPNDNFTTGEAGGRQYSRVVTVMPVQVVAGVSVRGIVRDNTAAAMPGAAVALWQGGVQIATTTSLDGSYAFADLSTGSYTVKAVSADSEKKGEANVTVAAADVQKDLTVSAGVLGDVTGEGAVNIFDVLALHRHVAGRAQLGEDALRCADVTGEGAVNIFDVLKLHRFVAGRIASLS